MGIEGTKDIKSTDQHPDISAGTQSHSIYVPDNSFTWQLGIELFQNPNQLEQLTCNAQDLLENYCEAYLNTTDNLIKPTRAAASGLLDKIRHIINQIVDTASQSGFTNSKLAKAIYDCVIQWSGERCTALTTDLAPQKQTGKDELANEQLREIEVRFVCQSKPSLDIPKSSEQTHPFFESHDVANDSREGDYLIPQQLFSSHNTEDLLFIQALEQAGLSHAAMLNLNIPYIFDFEPEDGMYFKGSSLTLRPPVFDKQTGQAVEAELFLDIKTHKPYTLAVCCSRDDKVQWQVLEEGNGLENGSGRISLGKAQTLLGLDNIVTPAALLNNDTANSRYTSRLSPNASKPLCVRIFSVVPYDRQRYINDKLNHNLPFDENNPADLEEVQQVINGTGGILSRYRFDVKSNGVSFICHLQPSQARLNEHSSLLQFRTNNDRLMEESEHDELDPNRPLSDAADDPSDEWWNNNLLSHNDNLSLSVLERIKDLTPPEKHLKF